MRPRPPTPPLRFPSCRRTLDRCKRSPLEDVLSRLSSALAPDAQPRPPLPRFGLPMNRPGDREVLECGRPLPLSVGPARKQSGRGLPHSRTLSRAGLRLAGSWPVSRSARNKELSTLQRFCQRLHRARLGLAVLLPGLLAAAAHGDSLDDLALPREGRAMRATSTMRVGRGASGRRGTQARSQGRSQGRPGGSQQLGQLPRRRPAKRTSCWMPQGPAMITHIWITFLGPEPQAWAKDGSANHQEMLLRMYWDGTRTPGGRGAVGRFLRQLLRPTPRGHQPARWRSRTPTPTIASGGCRSGNRPGSRS